MRQRRPRTSARVTVVRNGGVVARAHPAESAGLVVLLTRAGADAFELGFAAIV